MALRNYFFFLFSLLLISGLLSCSTNSKRPNILFIAVDDLRPQLGCYGKDQMITPNIDRLAKAGRLFTNHFVQVPTCGASRYAMLSGRRPFQPHHIGNEAIRIELADQTDSLRSITWPEFFRRRGYESIALGKVGHYPDSKVYSYSGEGDGRDEMPGSWDQTWGPVGKWGTAWNAFFGYSDGRNRNSLERNVLPYEKSSRHDDDLPDGLIAEKAVETLQTLSETGKPFLLAVGFFKPHLPFTAPQKYWDLYDRNEIQVSDNPTAPEGVNPASLHDSGELFRSYRKFPEKGGAGNRISDESARLLRHAYFASISYVDAQVGKVLDALDQHGLKDNTIVILWGDHGWHLGDHTIWGKHTNFDRSLQSALLMHFPGQVMPGAATDAVVETVDIYPTLVQACGFEIPAGLDGESLLPLVDDPEYSLDKVAVSYFRGAVSLRDPRYRLTWYPTADTIPVELYDHHTDPYETENIAPQNPQIANRLQKELKGYYSGLYDE